MFHHRRSWLILILILVGLTSCSNKSVNSSVTGSSSTQVVSGEGNGSSNPMKAEIREATADEKYQTALLESLSFLADKKYVESIGALQTAQTFRDSVDVRQQI